MRKHGEQIKIDFGINLPVNVCKNPDCGIEFVLLYVRDNGDVWEQVGNGTSVLSCPYCKEPVGK